MIMIYFKFPVIISSTEAAHKPFIFITLSTKQVLYTTLIVAATIRSLLQTHPCYEFKRKERISKVTVSLLSRTAIYQGPQLEKVL